MAWHLKVNKIFHCYWGTGNLPNLRLRTVTSFMKHNPDWKIMLWMPVFSAPVVTWKTKELNYENRWTNFRKELLSLPIEKKYVDMEDYGLNNNISEVHKSDTLRFWFLSTFGGVWSDMDIFYFRPIENLKVNIPANSDKETFVCISHYGHSNGFFMAAQGSEFFNSMLVISKRELKTDGYQSNGVNACNKHFPTLESINKISPAVNIGMDAVYAHDGQHILDLYSGVKSRFTEGSIGCHWYAGHPVSGQFLRDTDGGRKNFPDCILGNLLR